jgi:hypothetical protein
MLVIAAVVQPATGIINEKATRRNKFFENQPSMEFIPGELIVKIKQNKAFSNPALMTLNEKHQVYAFEKVFPNAEGTILDNIYLLQVPIGSDILSFVYEYASCSDVVYAEPNGIGHPCGIPDDTNFSNQYYLHNTGQDFYQGHHGTVDADIDAPEAWDMETGSTDVVIAIVDSGIDYTHPDLAANVWNNTDEIPGNGIDDDTNGYIDDIRGWNFYHNNSNVTDGQSHATFCAGIAGAVTNNSIGIAGVAWNCKIMPVRIANENWDTTIAIAALGIRYAADNNADVCSMSFGWYASYSIIKDAVDYAYEKGVFLCAAAGNDKTSTKLYPAAFENVTAVAGTNQYDTKYSRSNYGEWVDIAAPAIWIYSTTPSYPIPDVPQNYSMGEGTSFATPQVAGVAALLICVDSSLTPDEVKTLLCKNVDPYNSTEYIGTGRLNAQKALFALTPQPPNPPSIDGPTNGKIKQPHDYIINTTDPNGDDVSYYIDWGDNTNSGWIGPYSSGIEITQSHTWAKKGTYTIKAKAKDVYGNESDWTTLSVTMPYSFNIPFQPFWKKLFERFPNAFPILRHLLGY